MGNSHGKVHDVDRFWHYDQLPVWARQMLQDAAQSYSPKHMLKAIEAREAQGWDERSIRAEVHLMLRSQDQKDHICAFPGLVCHVQPRQAAAYIKRPARRKRK